MSNTYDVGDLVRVDSAFKDILGAAADPTTVTLKVLPPGGTVLTYTYALAEVTKSGTGAYYKDIPVTTAGTWYYRWLGTGAVVSAGEEYFHVRTPQAV